MSLLNLSRGLIKAALLLLAAMFAPTQALPRTVYVKTDRLLDVVTGRLLRDRCITISGDRISKVARCTASPAGATVIDWRGKTVLPGLIDLHTHLADVGQSADVAAPLKTDLSETLRIGAQNARATLLAGFTSVRDVGTYRGLSDVLLRDAIAKGEVSGPRMAVAGAYITIPGGGGELNGVMDNEKLPADMRLGVVRNPAEAKARATFLFDNVLCWEAAAAKGQQVSLRRLGSALMLF